MNDAILRRPGLLEVVRDTSAQILLVQAPSGYGKTTLVRSWMQESGLTDTPIIWVPLSTEVTNASAFWETVVTSARRLDLIDLDRATELLDGLAEGDDPIAAFTSVLVDGGPLVLIIDAYENLRETTAEIDAHLLGLTALSTGLRVIITTRTRSTLARSSNVVRGRVQILTERDLEFTAEETAEFLRAHASDEVQESAARIHRETHGYPLAVRAASLAATGATRTTARDGDGWGELVARDLMAQLPDPETLDFVRRTSVAPYFDLDLAIELAGTDKVDQFLAHLEWNGYGRWIPYAPDAPVFQYVEMFRDVMREDFATGSPEDFRAAAGTTSVWLHRNDEHEAAFEFAIGAEQYSVASRLFMSVLLSSPESYTTDSLDRHLQPLPHEVFVEYPVLAFARGLALLSNPATRAGAVPYLIRIADQTSDDWRGMKGPESFFLRVSKTACLRYVGRYREAAPAALEALDFYRSSEFVDDPTMVELRPIALRNVAYSMYQYGDPAGAAVVLAEAITTATVPWSKNYTVVWSAGLAAVEGRSHESASVATLVDPDAWPRDHAFTYVNALGRVGASTRLQDRFEFEAALSEYDGCESFLDTAEFWPFISWTRLHAMLALGTGETLLRQLTEAVDRFPPPPGTGENLGTATLRGLIAIGWFGLGNPVEAHQQLSHATPWPGQQAPAVLLGRLLSEEPGSVLRVVPALEGAVGHTLRSKGAVLTLGAAAALRAENPAAATTLLHRAAALHAAHGAAAHLIYLPASDLAALRELAAEGSNQEAVAYLTGDVPSLIRHAGQQFATLTERELAVAVALVKNPRRIDVAAALHVSPETVKSQVRSIYRKWEVSSRAELIGRGIELGVLKPDRG